MSFFKKLFSDNEKSADTEKQVAIATPESQWTKAVDAYIKKLCVDKTLYQQRLLQATNDYILADLKSNNWQAEISQADTTIQNYISDISENHIGKLRYNGELFSEDLVYIARLQTIIGESIAILNKSKKPEIINSRMQEAGSKSYQLVLFQDNPDFRKAWKVEQFPSDLCNDISAKHDDFFIDVYKDELKELEDVFDIHTTFTQKKNKLSKIIEKSKECEEFLYDKEKLNELRSSIKIKIDYYYLKDMVDQGNKFVFKNQLTKAKDMFLEGLYFLNSNYTNEISLDPIKKELEDKVAEIDVDKK